MFIEFIYIICYKIKNILLLITFTFLVIFYKIIEYFVVAELYNNYKNRYIYIISYLYL